MANLYKVTFNNTDDAGDYVSDSAQIYYGVADNFGDAGNAVLNEVGDFPDIIEIELMEEDVAIAEIA